LYYASNGRWDENCQETCKLMSAVIVIYERTSRWRSDQTSSPKGIAQKHRETRVV